MEDVEMSQAPPPPLPADRSQAAAWFLQEAKKQPRGLTHAEERIRYATQALRRAGADLGITAAANLILAECHELQDKWNLAYHEYLAARDCLRAAAGGPRRWTQDMEHALQYCYCKTHPR